ncbi:MAG: hypothetical protein ABIP77_04820 [Candidatus Limnocylindrales bacterium]
MRLIARSIAGHRLVASTVGVVATVVVTGSVVALSGAAKDPMDTFFTLGFMLAGGLGFTVVGSQILIAQPGHRIGRLMILMGASLVLNVGVQAIMEAVDPNGLRWGAITGLMRAVAEVSGGLALVGGVLIVAWFPDGRATSRLGRAALALTLAILILQLLRLVSPTFIDESALPFVLILGAYAIALVDLIVRYRRSDGVRRTQIRWVLASGAVTASLIVALLAFGERFWWLWPLWITSTMLPSLAIGIAITRYRLYEIDRIISRTIGYGLVTGALFVVFWAVNIGLQGLLSEATRSEPLIVAGSTLLVAALFNPLRGRVQRLVDSRFNRARYDAERTVERFSGRLRDELDLSNLAGELERTSIEAVEPTHSTVWLRAGGTP